MEEKQMSSMSSSSLSSPSSQDLQSFNHSVGDAENDYQASPCFGTLPDETIVKIFEEIIFRGIVYSTLRARFGVVASMVGRAGIFAVAHGYGLISFLAVFWRGLLWAWMY